MGGKSVGLQARILYTETLPQLSPIYVTSGICLKSAFLVSSGEIMEITVYML